MLAQQNQDSWIIFFEDQVRLLLSKWMHWLVQGFPAYSLRYDKDRSKCN